MGIRPLNIVILFLMSACETMKEDSSFRKEHAQWQEARIARLTSMTGWLNLDGVYWLEEGENTIGSDSSNNIIFPANAPPRIGSLLLEGGRIRFYTLCHLILNTYFPTQSGLKYGR
jgi:uncharacterized protein